MFREVENLSLNETVKRIISLNKNISKFWSNSYGWAPIEAAELLSKSRLDWQVSLSYTLNNWIENISKDEVAGNLILAWTNLGSLIEGTIKLALSVYYNDYLNSEDKIYKKDKVQEPDTFKLETLRQFCLGKLWERETKWDSWILHIQQRRNAVHAFKNREIGTFEEFYKDLSMYLEFLRYINKRLPYPDDIYIPCEE